MFFLDQFEPYDFVHTHCTPDWLGHIKRTARISVCLVMFIFNVNHTSSEIKASFCIVFMYSPEPVWNFFTTALCILFFYMMLLTRDIFYKALATFFPWCILCRRCGKWTLIVLVNTLGKRAQTIWAPHVIRDNEPVTHTQVPTTSHNVTNCTYMHEGHIFLNSGTWYL